MSKLNIGVLVLAVIFLSLAGCTVKEGTIEGGLTICADPRPEICTMDYNPVCGLSGSKKEKTYSNACTACSDTDVASYKIGECN